jgi:hypothetical protein
LFAVLAHAAASTEAACLRISLGQLPSGDCLNGARGALCRPVLALEHMIKALVNELDPVFGWSSKTQDPTQFLQLTDSILDVVHHVPSSSLSIDCQGNFTKAQFLKEQILRSRGAQWLFQRSIPLSADSTQLGINQIKARVSSM